MAPFLPCAVEGTLPSPPQGGYFVINGSEKVLIAQEKMSANHVYVFRKYQPCKQASLEPCSPPRGSRG